MKKIILSLITKCLLLQGFAQLNVGSTAQWVTTGNVTVVLSDMNLVNDGAIAAGTGSFKFTGVQNISIGGSSTPSFYIIEMAKTNNAKVLLGRNINVGSSIVFNSGQLDLNANNILMSSGANISGETEANRITGTNGGFIEINQNLNSPNSSNPGNLGVSITCSVNLGSVTIRRGHVSQSGTGLAGSINRYYSITAANNTNLDATLRLKYFDAELNGQNENELVIYNSSDNGSVWNNMSQTSRNATSNYVEKTGISSLSLQTLANDIIVSNNGATGVVLTGQRKKASDVTLKWTSQTETNMSGYQIQRRLDNESDFTDRAFVNTTAPAGNSISPISYQNIDPNSFTGTSYYRLKIIAANNTFTYSNEITIAPKTTGGGGGGNGGGGNGGGGNPHTAKATGNDSYNKLNQKITVGPNPNNGNFWFSVNGLEKETIAVLYSIDGKQIQKFRVVNQQQQKVTNIKTGIYLLKIPGYDTQKIIVNAGGNPGHQSIQVSNSVKN